MFPISLDSGSISTYYNTPNNENKYHQFSDSLHGMVLDFWNHATSGVDYSVGGTHIFGTYQKWRVMQLAAVARFSSMYVLVSEESVEAMKVGLKDERNAIVKNR